MMCLALGFVSSTRTYHRLSMVFTITFKDRVLKLSHYYVKEI